MKRGWKAAAVGFIALGLALTGGRASVGAAFCAYVLELTPFSTVTGAVGIDWYEPADAMLVSVNGPSGSPRNFSLVNPTTGAVSPFSALAGLPGEIKLATVKSGTCMGGFTFDQVFAGNGTPGQIMKMVTGGTTVTNPWVVLPGETGHIRGLYQDRHCAVGGDLVVVTSAGGIWRVTSAGVPTLVTRVARALEGVITLPNNPTIYGPLAGRILAGDEDRVGSPTFNGGNGRIFAVDPSGSTFTLGAPFGALVNYPLFSEFYGSTVSVNPEDFDIIPNQAILAAEFFGTSPSTNALLKSPPVIECACGSVVVSQEYVGDTGSSSNVLLWDPSLGSFTLEPTFDPNGDFITANFQHVAFRGVADCRACTGVIGDRIWKDLNGDGLQTPGEPGIAGVKVTLTKVGATGWSQSVFTDANGNYRFTGLCAGTYVVTVTAPSGDTFTTANVGSNRAIDSNVNGGQVILSADNSSDLTVDFGLKGPSVIGNFVWNDLNCNGIQDALEPGIAGVIVHLKAGLGNPGGADLTTTTTDANGAYQFLNLNPGDYTVVVDTPAGMNAAPALVGGVTVDSNGSPTNVTLTGGSPVDNSVDFGYCAPGGRIVVRKVTDPASDTTTMFTFNTTGTGYTGFTLTGGSSHDSGVLAAGTYGVTESPLAGWSQVGATCDNGNIPSAITLAAGQTVTCTFTNRKEATITVKKVMVGGTGSFAFTGSPAGTIAVNNGTLTQTVAAGTYTATEAAAPGWTLSSVVCDDTDSTGSTAGRAASFNVAAGENVTCTFTNTKDSTITVKKVMVGGTGSFAFTGSPAGTIATNNGTLTQTVAAGTYTATEAAAPGWTLSSVVCDDTDSTSNLAGGTATFNVASGENVTCTFTNTKAPQITVTKVVVNTGGGTKVVSDFPLKVDATTVTSGVQVTSTVGNHVVSETSDPNYTAVISGDCAANGAITLAAGDVKACTITNTFRAPKITVTKVVVNTGGGTKVISDFPLKVDATTVTSGVQVTSTTGNHVVSETSDPNYTAVISGDCAANGAITLAAGDVKACTITNTYKVPTGTPNLTITKTGNGSVKLGETATFTIAVTNVGPGTATGVVVTDTLPVGFIWADNQPACTIASGVMTCAIGSMAQGQVFTVVLSAPVTTTAVDCNCVKPEHHDGDHCEHESGSGGHHDGDDCEHEQSTDHHHSGDGDDHERRVNGHYSGDGCDHERQSHTPRHYAGDRCDHDKNINGHRSGDGCTHDRDSQRHKDGDNCDHERGRSGHRDGDGCTHEKDLHHHYAGDGDDHERGRYGHHAGDGCDHEKDSTAVPCLIKNIARVTATNENPTLLADNSSEARIGLAPTHRDGDDCDHEKGSHGHYDGDKCDHEKGTHHHYSGDGDDHERRVNGHAAGDGCDHERESHSSRHGIGDNCDHDKGINGHYRGDNCGHERDTKRHHKGDFCDHDKGVNGHRSGDGCQHEKEMHHHYSGDGDDHERGRFGHHNGDGCDHDKDTRNTFEGCACETPQHDDGDNCDHEQGRDGHHDGDSCDHEKGTGHHYRGDNDDHEARRNGHYSGDGCDHERQTHARRHFDGDDCSHERRASGHYRGDGCTHEGDLNQHHGGDRCDHDRRINGHRSGDGCRHEKDTEHHHRGDGDDHDSRRFGHYDGDNCHHDRENRPPTSEACVVPATGNSRLVSSSSAGADASDLTLTIARPASLQAGDVMIAAVVVRPSNATIAAPAGWTLVRRLSNSYGNSSALATYRKLATASEPASYTWTLNTSTGSAGGILAFRNVNSSNAASPVDVEAGVNTASSLSHTAPSVTTSAANEVVITVHSFASGASWAPPSGMAEAVDDSSWSVGGGSAGISFAMNYAVKASAGATGTKTATASNDPDTGNAQTIALRP